jgi:TonB family protein
MPETTPSHHPDAAYFPISTPSGAVDPARDGRAMPAVRTSPALVEASQLVLDGQQLLQESRAAEAEPLLLRALELYERQDDTPGDCVQVLGDLAAIATTRGDLIAAVSLLERALALANVRRAADHPDVATILGGLARLYLHRSEFKKAEPLLQRLLEIKRARGEEHPEVATVLASLATTHSAMGAHESAERVLRRALAIRERTLAPNHFATMTTLEHLADSCAARGKFDEALTLLHRAQAIRERTLGVSHPSIAAARTRIADLELLSSNEELGSVPMLPPMMATLPVFDARAEEPVDPDPRPPIQEGVELNEPPPLVVRGELYDERYDGWGDEVEEPRRNRWLLDQLNAFARTPRGRVTVLAIGVGSLLAAFVLAMRARADVAVTTADASLVSSQKGLSAGPRANADVALKPEFIAQPPPTPASARLTRSADFAGRSTTATTGGRRSAGSESTETVVAKDAEPIELPKAPTVGAFEATVDGAPIAPVRAPLVASADFTRPRASSTEQTPVSGTTDRTRGDIIHAMLLADNPAPVYPPELMRRRIEGRVVAVFLVDAMGRVDTRTLRINTSTDERFSAAVRAVLPSLRFRPAEGNGVRTEDWVEMPFRFSPKPE